MSKKYCEVSVWHTVSTIRSNTRRSLAESIPWVSTKQCHQTCKAESITNITWFISSTTLKGQDVMSCNAIRYIIVDTLLSPPLCLWASKTWSSSSDLNLTLIWTPYLLKSYKNNWNWFTTLHLNLHNHEMTKIPLQYNPSRKRNG